MQRIKAGFYNLFSLVFFLLFFSSLYSQELIISKDQRFITKRDKTPFFYLGDTAWELFHRTDQSEADMYLENRASKGFNVIQAVVLAELDGIMVPNVYGELPLLNHNPATPNLKYFEHVDYIIKKTGSLGMMIGMLPTWGDKFNKKWGAGPEIFTPKNAFEFGKFLGERYKNDPIIWILGGDRNPDNEEDIEIIKSMARGLAVGDKGSHLMTYHPQGGSNSSEWFHDEDWLDFNFFQSGHGPRDQANYEFTIKNYELEPVKPTLDGEPRYEDHPVRFNPLGYGWFDDFDVRQAGYWSMFSGACGHTYGNHNIWQMWQEDRKAVSWARTNWRRALDHSGAYQMGYMKQFFEAYPWQNMVPDQKLILNFNPKSGAYQVAMISQNKDMIFVYNPYGYPVKADISRLQANNFNTFWYNPRDGEYMFIRSIDKSFNDEFTPPSMGRGSDWVLIIQDATKTFNDFTKVN